MLNGNPLDDVRQTANIGSVMKGGVLYDAETVDELWPERRPFGPRYWAAPDVQRTDTRPADYWDRRPPR